MLIYEGSQGLLNEFKNIAKEIEFGQIHAAVMHIGMPQIDCCPNAHWNAISEIVAAACRCMAMTGERNSMNKPHPDLAYLTCWLSCTV